MQDQAVSCVGFSKVNTVIMNFSTLHASMETYVETTFSWSNYFTNSTLSLYSFLKTV